MSEAGAGWGKDEGVTPGNALPGVVDATPVPGQVLAFDFVDGRSGWVLTTSGLRVTQDGGRSWAAAFPPPDASAAVAAATFTDPRHGWIVIRSSVNDPPQLEIKRTLDGGRTWMPVGDRPLSLPPDATGHISIQVANGGRHLWLSVRRESSSNFSRGQLLFSDDGGQTWKSSELPLGEAVTFLNSKLGWVAGGPDGGQLFVTRDGGRTWERQNVAAPSWVTRTDAPLFGRIMILPEQAVLPVTWPGEPSGIAFYGADPSGNWLYMGSVQFPYVLHTPIPAPTSVVGAGSWVAATPNGAWVIRTRDGGRTWEHARTQGLPGAVMQIDFVSPSEGWALMVLGECRAGKDRCPYPQSLRHTVDGGTRWTEVDVP